MTGNISTTAFRWPELLRQGARVHIAGVAGVGMNPLAQALAACGCTVSGSDRFLDQGSELPVLRQLRAAGIALLPQDGSGVTADTALLAVSTAIEPSNPDIAAAQRLGIPVAHRSEVLAALTRRGRCIGVAGTSGKTTTTGMTGWILDHAGLRPNVVNGGVILNWADPDTIGNVRISGGDLWVVETDESDRSLLNFSPEAAILTTVTADHFPLPETIDLFNAFIDRVSGPVICGPGVKAVLGRVDEHLIEPAFDLHRGDGGWIVAWDGVEIHLPLPGRHNAIDAVCAAALARAYGVDAAGVKAALEAFRGIDRRLTPAHAPGAAVRVYDDYGHNPEKIAAAWEAVQETVPGRVWGVWRPHGYGPLAATAADLLQALAARVKPDERVFILPVFYAGGTANRKMESEDLVRMLVERGVPAEWVADYEALASRLTALACPGDAILIMGARDPRLPVFAREMVHWDRRLQGG